MTQSSMAEQADRERVERDRKLNDEALQAQKDRDAKTEQYLGADEYVVLGSLIQYKAKDGLGGFLVKQANEGAVLKSEDLDEDNLRHLVDIRYLVPVGADEAEFAGPAGTPKPGEPPNVPVVEGTPVEMLPLEERMARQREAADKAAKREQQTTEQRKTARQPKSDQGNG